MRSCYRCNSGSYQSGFGASQCTRCELGTYATGRAMTACLACRPGTAKPYTASKYTCNLCLGGTYQPASAASACIACAASTYSTGQAATACAPYPRTDCNGTAGGTAVVGCDGACGSGRVVGGCDRRCGSAAVKGCDGVCGSGSIRGGAAAQALHLCFPCPENATCPTPHTTDIVCHAGFYTFFDFSVPFPAPPTRCASCPPGSTSPAGSGTGTGSASCACMPLFFWHGWVWSWDRFSWEPDCRPCPPPPAACPATSPEDMPLGPPWA